MTDRIDPTGRTARATTLVVEDDHNNRELLIRLLDGCGLACDHAVTLAEALDKLQAVPKLVLLDLQLPDGDGVDVLRAIRARRLPVGVGVMTGCAEENRLAELRTFLPDAIFIKPVDITDMLAWVQAYLRNADALA